MSTIPNPQPSDPAANSTETKIEKAVDIGAAVAEQFTPAAISAIISEGVGLEPAIYHLIEAFTALFKHHTATVAAQAK